MISRVTQAGVLAAVVLATASQMSRAQTPARNDGGNTNAPTPVLNPYWRRTTQRTQVEGEQRGAVPKKETAEIQAARAALAEQLNERKQDPLSRPTQPPVNPMPPPVPPKPVREEPKDMWMMKNPEDILKNPAPEGAEEKMAPEEKDWGWLASLPGVGMIPRVEALQGPTNSFGGDVPSEASATDNPSAPYGGARSREEPTSVPAARDAGSLAGLSGLHWRSGPGAAATPAEEEEVPQPSVVETLGFKPLFATGQGSARPGEVNATPVLPASSPASPAPNATGMTASLPLLESLSSATRPPATRPASMTGTLVPDSSVMNRPALPPVPAPASPEPRLTSTPAPTAIPAPTLPPSKPMALTLNPQQTLRTLTPAATPRPTTVEPRPLPTPRRSGFGPGVIDLEPSRR